VGTARSARSKGKSVPLPRSRIDRRAVRARVSQCGEPLEFQLCAGPRTGLGQKSVPPGDALPDPRIGLQAGVSSIHAKPPRGEPDLHVARSLTSCYVHERYLWGSVGLLWSSDWDGCGRLLVAARKSRSRGLPEVHGSCDFPAVDPADQPHARNWIRGADRSAADLPPTRACLFLYAINVGWILPAGSSAV